MSTQGLRDASADVIPSISIEALIAARDHATRTYNTIRGLLLEADERMRPFDVTLPRLEVHFPGGSYRNLRDTHYSDALLREIDRAVWKALFRSTNVELLMDSNTRRDLHSFLERSGLDQHGPDDMVLPPLTVENVNDVLRGLHADRAKYFEASIVSLYRSISWNHRTNLPAQFGQRMILSVGGVLMRREHQGATCNLGYSAPLSDLERVVLLLDKQPPQTSTTGVRQMHSVPWGVWTLVPAPVRPVLRVKIHRNGRLWVELLQREHVDFMNAVIARHFPGALPPPDQHLGRKRAARVKA